MNIVVIHGQMHHGSTYNITKKFIQYLSMDNAEISEFFLPKDAPDNCIGCYTCFTKGEDHCPHAQFIQPIASAIENADLIILESPCYVMGMTGQLKSFLDHLGYRWFPHRPHPKMFHKIGLVLSTAAGAGTKKVTKALSRNLFYWGVAKTFAYGKNVGAQNWETVSEKKKLKIEKEVAKKDGKIKKQLVKVKTGFKTKFMFYIMRLTQKGNDWNYTDKEHWIQNGWLEKNRPW